MKKVDLEEVGKKTARGFKVVVYTLFVIIEVIYFLPTSFLELMTLVDDSYDSYDKVWLIFKLIAIAAFVLMFYDYRNFCRGEPNKYRWLIIIFVIVAIFFPWAMFAGSHF
jgi:RsiW-degrading membrane proteinase PrsW (M82 family)